MLPVMPTMPAYVAEFVSVSSGSMKLDDLIAATQEVSRLHTDNGLADPCTAQVAAAFNAIAPIEPPRSWPKDQKVRFTELPYDLQRYVAAHEDQRERGIRRAQNEAAVARQALAAIQKPTEVSHGTIDTPAAAH
ncbi:hypothetical protein [Bradyrhizobium sp. CW1]|uniref:hypothetical protein n=1 Tax=Bradyrhizobium sp. CW1 TaxID=2782686 RepID=UPI001FFECFB5|nr:hypothetical protein [Bradyrhizobium sp. CW1]UPJ31013.1 hypothetical protein IVB54_19410 [Bradyrhizobium sp. CW1]